MCSRVNRQLLPGRETLCFRQDDGTFIRPNCAILGAIGNDDDFHDISLPEENMMPVRFPHRLKMKCVAQMSPATTNARSAAASRALVVDGNGKTQSRCASVSDTAAVVAFRLRSSRLSACTSLCRPPNR